MPTWIPRFSPPLCSPIPPPNETMFSERRARLQEVGRALESFFHPLPLAIPLPQERFYARKSAVERAFSSRNGSPCRKVRLGESETRSIALFCARPLYFFASEPDLAQFHEQRHEKARCGQRAFDCSIARHRQTMRDSKLSAWRTAGACGPSSDRTSCAPPYGRRA